MANAHYNIHFEFTEMANRIFKVSINYGIFNQKELVKLYADHWDQYMYSFFKRHDLHASVSLLNVV